MLPRPGEHSTGCPPVNFLGVIFIGQLALEDQEGESIMAKFQAEEEDFGIH